MECKYSADFRPYLVLAGLLSTFVGCVAANPRSVPTIWDGLGLPQAVAGVRDATINRNGRFPNLERKPPVLKLADPANMAPEKPEMIKTAAKIKADQDMKKQKIKAIKFLAEVNCGCYNKDDKVAKAFLAGLEDCDPEVRQAAVEGLTTAAGNCSRCRNQCEPNCCTEEILKKVQDLATGTTESGCCKEPVKEIRVAAAALLKKCPSPAPKPLEEIPTPNPDEIEEIMEEEQGETGTAPRGETGGIRFGGKGSKVSYRLNDNSNYGSGDEPVVISQATESVSAQIAIRNPDELIAARIVGAKPQLGEILVELPGSYGLNDGWTMVVVYPDGQQLARVTESSGRRVLMSLDGQATHDLQPGDEVKIGLVAK